MTLRGYDDAAMPKSRRPPQPKLLTKSYIRAWRAHRGLTLEQLAGRLGEAGMPMVPSNLSMLERGQRGYSQRTIEMIAQALDTDVASLLARHPDDAAIWTLWEKAMPNERAQILEITQSILKHRN